MIQVFRLSPSYIRLKMSIDPTAHGADVFVMFMLVMCTFCSCSVWLRSVQVTCVYIMSMFLLPVFWSWSCSRSILCSFCLWSVILHSVHSAVVYTCSVHAAGVYTLDQILIVFGSTGMLVGGITAFVLDNTIPGWCYIA